MRNFAVTCNVKHIKWHSSFLFILHGTAHINFVNATNCIDSLWNDDDNRKTLNLIRIYKKVEFVGLMILILIIREFNFK